MEIKRLHTLAIKYLKQSVKIIRVSWKTYFTKRDPKIRPYDIIVRHSKSAKYDDESLIPLGPKVWNQLPSSVKSLTSKFKE